MDEDRIIDVLPIVGNLYATRVPIGSTLGFDELRKHKFETFDREVHYKTKEFESLIHDQKRQLPVVLHIDLTTGNFLI